MDQLFKFLVNISHLPFIAAIVIGLAASIYNKWNKAALKSMDEEKEVIQTLRQDPELAEELTEKRVSMQEIYEERRKALNSNSGFNKEFRSSPYDRTAIASRYQQRETEELSFSKKEAVKGVIWAEILGPPQSRKKASVYRRKK
ncbi:hypothetical protein [Metabacillus sp. RGM 3146]|uniref:hypothetical protein n=1 Tax=Metabacillus sp. RGM 3146 TaxID=3401092 RepID=UPI003B9C37FC